LPIESDSNLCSGGLRHKEDIDCARALAIENRRLREDLKRTVEEREWAMNASDDELVKRLRDEVERLESRYVADIYGMQDGSLLRDTRAALEQAERELADTKAALGEADSEVYEWHYEHITPEECRCASCTRYRTARDGVGSPTPTKEKA